LGRRTHIPRPSSGVRESVCSASSSEPSLALREAIKSGASNLKERLFIQLESDKSNNAQYFRRGDVHCTGWKLGLFVQESIFSDS
jgi:hypothetical protein